MLDEKDLQAIQAIILEAEQRITKKTVVLMEAEFKPRFDLLAEGQEAILDRLDRMEDRLEDMDVMDSRITALEAMVKKLNREVAALKKAN
ncbi:hypothetical protein [Evtepia sp.]|uniref:hypothetical protein n=1 Tax=Evtepia sp. TaxID=2773933 RepID=UPI003F17017F